MVIRITNESQSYNNSNIRTQKQGAQPSVFESKTEDYSVYESPYDISDNLISNLGHRRKAKAAEDIQKINKDNVIVIYEQYDNYCSNYPKSNPSLVKNILDTYDQRTAQKLLVHIVNALKDKAKSQNVDINPEIKEFNEAIRRDVKWYQFTDKIKKRVDIDWAVKAMVDKLR